MSGRLRGEWGGGTIRGEGRAAAAWPGPRGGPCSRAGRRDLLRESPRTAAGGAPPCSGGRGRGYKKSCPPATRRLKNKPGWLSCRQLRGPGGRRQETGGGVGAGERPRKPLPGLRSSPRAGATLQAAPCWGGTGRCGGRRGRTLHPRAGGSLPAAGVARAEGGLQGAVARGGRHARLPRGAAPAGSRSLPRSRFPAARLSGRVIVSTARTRQDARGPGRAAGELRPEAAPGAGEGCDAAPQARAPAG